MHNSVRHTQKNLFCDPRDIQDGGLYSFNFEKLLTVCEQINDFWASLDWTETYTFN